MSSSFKQANLEAIVQLVERYPSKLDVEGSNLSSLSCASIAQRTRALVYGTRDQSSNLCGCSMGS